MGTQLTSRRSAPGPVLRLLSTLPDSPIETFGGPFGVARANSTERPRPSTEVAEAPKLALSCASAECGFEAACERGSVSVYDGLKQLNGLGCDDARASVESSWADPRTYHR